MTIEETNILHEKAKTQKDGVYSYRGNLWVVKSNRFIAFVNNRGEVWQRFGSFNTKIGDLNMIETWKISFLIFFYYFWKHLKNYYAVTEVELLYRNRGACSRAQNGFERTGWVWFGFGCESCSHSFVGFVHT